MDTINTLISKLQEHALSSPVRQIVGRAALVKALFAHLYSQENALTEWILLCAKDGFIIHCENNPFHKDLSGHTLDVGALVDSCDEPLIFQAFGDYIIIAATGPTTLPAVKSIQTRLTELLNIIDEDESSSRYLLKCLNSVKNAISIYDAKATLLYANTSFCKDLSIPNISGAIGSDINTITKNSGIKIHSMEDNSSKLKMMDVLKNGKEMIDWEVRIESVHSKSESKLLSNDMYPVLDDSGRVTGMVELTHSRKQDIKRARKIMGLAAEYSFDSIIGSSLAIREQIRRAKEFANSPFNFLITGESGVGKELFAQSIHNYSDRKKGPFVALNCANFSEGLIESELFGYIGGAFTGASKNGQTGKFELANGGTLFLDEIGELPYHFQSKLLRVLETWIVTRIGSSQQIPVDVRLVAATNRNLDEMAAEGLFRQDLYYRLQVLNIEIPPLRERKEDLPLLSDCFLKLADPSSDAPKVLDADAKNALMEYDWPGNVRELRNVMNRVSILSKGQIITRDVLEASIYSKGRAAKPVESTAGEVGADSGTSAADASPEDRLNKRRSDVDASYSSLIKEALDITRGNKKQAAELLGVSRKTFYRMLEKYTNNSNFAHRF